MQKYHIFDLDGTLVDSIPTYVRINLEILDEYGVVYPSDIINRIMSLGYKGTAKYFIQLGVKNESVETLVKKMYAYAYDDYANKIPLKKGVKEYLKRLKSDGKEIFVLTASHHLVKDVCLQRNGVLDWFSDSWSSDDFSYNKADVRIYDEICKKLGCTPKDICFYDDNLTNIQTAKRAGLKTVGIFDESSEQYTEEIKKSSDEYHYSFEEL